MLLPFVNNSVFLSEPTKADPKQSTTVSFPSIQGEASFATNSIKTFKIKMSSHCFVRLLSLSIGTRGLSSSSSMKNPWVELSSNPFVISSVIDYNEERRTGKRKKLPFLWNEIGITHMNRLEKSSLTWTQGHRGQHSDGFCILAASLRNIPALRCRSILWDFCYIPFMNIRSLSENEFGENDISEF